MPLKKCLTCGELFLGRTEQAKCDKCLAEQRETTMRPRTCRQCGVEFLGGPRAWYCPTCREERKREATKRYRQRGPLRPIGSIDRCVICGAEYTVNGTRQMYCAACAPEAIRRVDREQSIAWANAHSADRTHETRYGQKICVICGNPIPRERKKYTCSPECEKKLKYHTQAITDYARGRRASLPKLSRIDEELRRPAVEETPADGN